VRLPWLAQDEALGPYITIPQYWFNKTKQHTPWPSTGLCRLMIANWISLHHGDMCGGCKIHCHHCLCPCVQYKAGTREKLCNTYRSYMLLLTEISKASSSRMVSCLYMSPSSYRCLDGILVCSNHFNLNSRRPNVQWFPIGLNYTRLMYYILASC